MKNAAGALNGLYALEDEAIAAHSRVAEALEGMRVLLDRAIIHRYGKVYQISGLRAYRGIVKAYGVRVYNGKVGIRGYDLGDLRECKLINLLDEGDAIKLKIHQPKPKPDPRWHPNHR